jgi:signal transduction histidine kinase
LVSRKSETNKTKERFSLLSLIQEILEFLYPSIAYGEVEVVVKVGEDLILHGYRDEIKQVMINLILNSIDALQQVSQAKQVKISAEITANGIRVSVSNNGPAIPAQLIHAIFEPFVTTKDLGTGLGLFVCKQMVENHGGTIECESADRCTRFTLHFSRESSQFLNEKGYTDLANL